MDQIRIAVIGAGPAGLTALKCLREEGFDAVAFERRGDAGGLWSYSDDKSYTSILETTVVNLSKFVAPFSDFPFPKDYPVFPTGRQMGEYFQSYARHFGLDEHIRFGTTVHLVTRDEARSAWNVSLSGPEGAQVLPFDKVVLAHGLNPVPNMPPMPGRDKFTGSVIHGQQYRTHDDYVGKRVLVVGNANSGCEVALHLARHTTKLYHAYRRGRVMTSRYADDGVCVDSTASWSAIRTKYLLEWYYPRLASYLVDGFLGRKMVSDAARCEEPSVDLPRGERLARARAKIEGEWGLVGCPSLSLSNPNGQENWFPAVYEGRITPVPAAFESFTGPDRVRLVDGSEIQVDAVIFCTGYRHQWNIMPDLEMDGACDLPLRTAKDDSPQSGPPIEDTSVDENPQPPHLPRLHRLIFPPKYASSAALLNYMAPQESAWCIRELSSMAIAQLWAAEVAQDNVESTPARPSNKAPVRLPPVAEMEAEVDGYHAWWRGLYARDRSALEGYVPGHTLYRYLHEAAGTGMYERLDHMLSVRGWGLWWTDRELHTWLAWGPMNAHAWRLFETNPEGVPGCGRRAWPGARAAIKDTYELWLKYKEDMKDETLRRKEMMWDNNS